MSLQNQFSVRRVIVTGGAGFIGSHVTDALLAAGCEILVLDDLSTGNERNLNDARALNSGRLTLRVLDICSDECEKVVREFQPDAIVHHAAQMNVRRSVAEPVFDAEKNVVGTVRLLHAASLVGTKRFILASTGGAIYGEQEQFPAPESHPSHAECPYGVSKRAGELYLEYYARAHSMSCVGLRYANVYGPRQNSKGEAGVVAIFCERALRREQLTVNGDGLQTRDFVYVADVVAANLAVLRTLSEPGFFVFNVGTGKESNVLDIVRGIAQAHVAQGGAALNVQHGPSLPGEQRRSVVDPALIGRRLGWKPEMSLDRGLLQTYASFRAVLGG